MSTGPALQNLQSGFRTAPPSADQMAVTGAMKCELGVAAAAPRNLTNPMGQRPGFGADRTRYCDEYRT